MTKRCERCGQSFWGRWRNDPDVCAVCLAASAPVIDAGGVRIHFTDPSQLSLFDPLRPVAQRDPDDFWYSLRPIASQAERRRSPYA